jgi:hypothetical protein
VSAMEEQGASEVGRLDVSIDKDSRIIAASPKDIGPRSVLCVADTAASQSAQSVELHGNWVAGARGRCIALDAKIHMLGSLPSHALRRASCDGMKSN